MARRPADRPRAADGGAARRAGRARTGETLDELNERLAVIDAAQSAALRHGRGDGVAEGHPRQQADARRLRPGPDGDDRARRPAAGRLRVPDDARQQVAAGLRDPPARRPAPAGGRREIPARRRSPSSAARATTRRASSPRRRVRADVVAPRRRHRGEISHARRDAGRGADVRALGIDLRRPRRAFRRRRAARAPGARGDRLAVADDDGDPGRAVDAARRGGARIRARDPGRGRQADGRRAPARRARRQARKPFPRRAGRSRRGHGLGREGDAAGAAASTRWISAPRSGAPSGPEL